MPLSLQLTAPPPPPPRPPPPAAVAPALGDPDAARRAPMAWVAAPAFAVQHAQPVTGLHLARQRLVTVAGPSVHVIRADDAALLPGPPPHGRLVVASAVDGRHIATACMDGSLRTWCPGPSGARELPRPAAQPSRLAMAGGRLAAACGAATELYDVARGTTLWGTARASGAPVTPAIDALGLAAPEGERVCLWSAETARARELLGPSARVTAVALDARRVAAGCADGTVWLWSRAAGALVFAAGEADGVAVRRIRLVGRRLVVGNDRSWRFFGAQSGQMHAHLASFGAGGDGAPVGHLWAHIDGGGGARLDALGEGGGQVPLSGRPRQPRVIASAGHRLAIGGEDGGVSVWRLMRAAATAAEQR